MDRRWTAAAGLLAVLLAAVIVPLAGRTYPGRPVATPPPGPPAVGDCLQDRLPADRQVAYLIVGRFGPCAAWRSGEISAVLDDFATAMPSGPDPVDRCTPSGRRYLGLADDGTLPGLQGRWTPVVSFGVALVPPGQRQRTAGQKWGACVVFPLGVTAEDLYPGYAHPLRDVFRSGLPPSRMADCGDSVIGLLGYGPSFAVPCDRAHGAELLAYRAPVEKNVQQHDLDLDCREIARRLIGRTDPTAGGVLTVRAVAGLVETAGVRDGWNESAGSVAACTVAPTEPGRRLTGPLLGLGDGPIPWA